MTVPQFKLTFDVGHGSPQLVDFPKILLTHGHLDHSSGLPYIISQRALRHLAPAEVFCPPGLADPLRRILDVWAEVEGFRADYVLTPIDYATDYLLTGKFSFRAIPSVHRVTSNGYVIFEKTTRLKEEFRALPGPEIVRLKKERNDLFYDTEIPTITFSGDTQIEFVLENEIVRESKVLFLECTYISDDRPVERARQWGHTHLYEIAAHAEAFRNVERLFLIHFSPRYRPEDIRAAIQKRLPGWLAERTVPWIQGPTRKERPRTPH